VGRLPRAADQLRAYEKPKVKSDGASVTHVAFNQDGTRVISVSEDDTLRLWSALPSQPPIFPVEEPETKCAEIACSPDGTQLVSHSKDGTLQIWDTSKNQPIGQPFQPFKRHEEDVSIVAFSPDGTRIVFGGTNGTLRLFNTRTGKPVGQPIQDHEDWVHNVAFSPDGTRIVSSSGDLRLWDVNSWQLLPDCKPLMYHQGESAISSVAFSPDGAHIVYSSSDYTIWLWDAKTCKPVGQPLTLQDPINSVVFSQQGDRVIYVTDQDSSPRLWYVLEGWTDQLCAKLDHNMSHKEWRDWVSPDIDYIEQCQGLSIPPDEQQVNSASTEATQP
jgi:WD40 repeat protein